MSTNKLTVLCVGATGSVGRHVVEEALRRGHAMRALVRSRAKAAGLPTQAEVVVGELTQPETLPPAVAGVDAIIFTHGSNGGKAETSAIDYGGVRNVLFALRGRKLRIALMTAIGVTDRAGSYNRRTEAHDWKRRSERLVRASGNAYGAGSSIDELRGLLAGANLAKPFILQCDQERANLAALRSWLDVSRDVLPR